MASSRRERMPTGQNNLSPNNFQAQVQSARMNQMSNSGNFSSRIASRDNMNMTGGSTNQFDNSMTMGSDRGGTASMMNMTGAEIMRTIKAREIKGRNDRMTEELMTLKGADPNCFSRPVASMKAPLRTVFLDPEVNNIVPSNTRTQLRQRIKASVIPHPSFDLDNDGFVSQHDYRRAKRFDLSGDGILDQEEAEICKRIMTEEFFKEHADELDMISPDLSSPEKQADLQETIKGYKFDRAFEAIKGMETTLKSCTSKPLRECLKLPKGNPLTPHNYFVDKFDSTAWNDFDAIPRSASVYGLKDHGGSRKRLMFSRQQVSRVTASSIMEEARLKKPIIDTRRLKLITDVAVENS